MAQEQTVYTTKDGRRYGDKAMAERHERLTDAQNEYESARRRYSQALLETQVTADGKPFKFGVLTTYYYVHPNYNGGLPFLRSVEFSQWDSRMDESDEFNIVTKADDGRNIHYRIGDLYTSKREAEVALLHKQMEKVSDLAADVLALRQRLGLMNVELGVDGASSIAMIKAERDRQIKEEGWSTEHDDQWVNEELASAAAYYVSPSDKGVPIHWPWAREWNKKDKHDRIRQLAIAGALIAAEIDRLQRAAAKE